MQIQIIKVDNINKGKFNQLDVTFKNLTDGKVGNKKLVSFTNKDVYEALVNSKDGDSFNITTTKNEATGYWDWTAANKGAAANAPVATQAPRSTYETADERALKQVYIVRQSSLSTATTLLTAGAKTPPPVDAIIEVAKKLEAYVFGSEQELPASFIPVPNVDVE